MKSPTDNSRPTPVAGPACRRARHGFTLIELLTVIGIIGILSAISFGIIKGVNSTAMEARTRSELASIELALEQYKGVNGDYPQTNIPEQLFDALMGRLGPKMATLSPPEKPFLNDISIFTITNPKLINTPNSNQLLDPWGNYYRYVYKVGLTGSAWTQPPLLYSFGPDMVGVETLAGGSGGLLDMSDARNQDNIFPGN
jgi:prepilin-type N-terminal cleavage/methylation domain-containing protein